jgi:hypothetical protein
MSDDVVRCLSIPGSEYELLEFESGLWGAQPPKGGRWSQENTAAEALIAAGWGGEDGDRKTVYDFDGNTGHLLYRNDEREFAVVDWSYSGGSVEITETDDLRGEDECFSCGAELHWSRIQTRQFHANWQEATCPICGEDARLEERGSHWYRV